MGVSKAVSTCCSGRSAYSQARTCSGPISRASSWLSVSATAVSVAILPCKLGADSADKAKTRCRKAVGSTGLSFSKVLKALSSRCANPRLRR